MSARVAVALLAALLGVGLCAAVDIAPAAASSPQQPYRLGANGLTAPIYSYARAIRQTVWVDIGLDQDGDGVHDRVAVDIIRPLAPARAHQRIPVIMDTSGYYEKAGRGNEMQRKTYDKHGRPVQFPLFLDNYFVPRGYAVVLVDLAGTNRSTGCTDYGGPSELRSSTRVIDWLNGRAAGYASPLGPARRYANWASGRVGMIGKSWDGQNAVETAVTGIDGLDAVVPESAVTSDWTEFYDRTGSPSYFPTTADYTLDNGELQNARALHNKHCRALLEKVKAHEPLTGNYTREWAYRDWAPRAGRVRAAVLMTQGQNDTTVFPANLRQWWSRLPTTLPKKLWLSEVGHVDPFDFRRPQWVDTVHRWFDRFLYRIHNGILRTPQLSVERAPNRWVDYGTYPARAARTVSVWTTAVGAPDGGLALQPGPAASIPIPTTSTQMVQFDSPRLSKAMRISGSANVVVGVSTSTNRNVNVEAQIVDLGRTTTRGYSARPGSDREFTGILNPHRRKSCWGASRPGDSGCFWVTPADVVTVDSQVLGWGTRDLWHHSSVRVVQPVVANHQYSLRIPSYGMDRIVPAGHRLALQVFAYGPDGSTTSVHLSSTRIELPVVGGAVHFAAADHSSTLRSPAGPVVHDLTVAPLHLR